MNVRNVLINRISCSTFVSYDMVIPGENGANKSQRRRTPMAEAAFNRRAHEGPGVPVRDPVRAWLMEPASSP